MGKIMIFFCSGGEEKNMLGATGLKISGSTFLLLANEVDVFFFIL